MMPGVAAMTNALGVGLIALALGQAPPAAPAKPGELRVMTYNIKHGQTNAACTQPAATPGQPPAPDCNLDLQAAIAVIREHHPDVIGLQEIDRFWARSGYLDEPAVLSAALGMAHRCYAANLDHPADVHADRPHQYGTLILSRFPIRSCSNTPLPRSGENEQRGFTLAAIDVRGVAAAVLQHPPARDRGGPAPPDGGHRSGARRGRCRREGHGRRLQCPADGDGAAAAVRPIHRCVGQGRRCGGRQPGRAHLAR